MDDLDRDVHARVPYVTDRELHVSTVLSPNDGRFVDLREFVPSLEAYGRGVTFPIGMLHDVLEGFESAWHENGGGDWRDETRDRLEGKASNG